MTELAEKLKQQRGGSYAVGIIVAIDGDIVTSLKRMFNHGDRFAHAEHQEGIG